MGRVSQLQLFKLNILRRFYGSFLAYVDVLAIEEGQNVMPKVLGCEGDVVLVARVGYMVKDFCEKLNRELFQ